VSATWEIRQGDALDRLREMPDESLQCCVTSPPYFQQRDYGVDGQVGLEPTVDEYLDKLVEVFAEVRRVLRSDGTLWLNIGDGWAKKADSSVRKTFRRDRAPAMTGHPSSIGAGVKRKDLLMVPARLALKLRADGWYLRDEIIWAKGRDGQAGMPGSQTDRCTRSHEAIYMLAKSEFYYYDWQAIRDRATSDKPSGNGYKRAERLSVQGRGQPQPWTNVGGLRTKRSVWNVSLGRYKEAHFATFPPKLVEPCILAGSPERICASCSAPWVPTKGALEFDLSRPQTRRAMEIIEEEGLTEEHIAAVRACGVTDTGRAAETQTGSGRNTDEVQALANDAKRVLGGYHRELLLGRPSRGEPEPTCDCDADTIAATVLDCFAGASTVGLVGTRLGRSYIGIEIKPEYVELGRRRLIDDLPLMNIATEVAAA
jgi:DNA modification methylase